MVASREHRQPIPCRPWHCTRRMRNQIGLTSTGLSHSLSQVRWRREGGRRKGDPAIKPMSDSPGAIRGFFSAIRLGQAHLNIVRRH